MKPIKMTADMAGEKREGIKLRPLLRTKTVRTALVTIAAGIAMPILERYGIVVPKAEVVSVLGGLLAIFLRDAIRTEGGANGG